MRLLTDISESDIISIITISSSEMCDARRVKKRMKNDDKKNRKEKKKEKKEDAR